MNERSESINGETEAAFHDPLVFWRRVTDTDADTFDSNH